MLKEHTNQEDKEAVAPALVRKQPASRGPAQRAGTQLPVGASFFTRSKQQLRFARVFRAVCLREYHRLDVLRDFAQSTEACGAVAPLRFGGDARPGRARYFGGAIRRPVIGDNDS